MKWKAATALLEPVPREAPAAKLRDETVTAVAPAGDVDAEQILGEAASVGGVTTPEATRAAPTPP